MEDRVDIWKEIFEKVRKTPFIDTHEHLSEESDRLSISPEKDSWISMMGPYFSDDLISAGLDEQGRAKLLDTELSLHERWAVVEPLWGAVRNTAYAKALEFSVKELYGIDEISFSTIDQIQEKYLEFRKEGFYKEAFSSRYAHIESCQVNSLDGAPFRESEQPELLMQDLSIVPMFAREEVVLGLSIEKFSEPANISVQSIDDWYKVIDWYFVQYGEKAVAVKSQNAYNRDLDYDPVAKESAAPLFLKRIKKEEMSEEEMKALENHLFGYTVGKATEYNLPVKLHTGYFAGFNGMPMARVARNPGDMSNLCMNFPNTRFVFMHMTYPYESELLALTKHHRGAVADMCWAWIIDPVAAQNFLKRYLVTAPLNKILTFGGDHSYVECTIGHAAIARRGIARALTELVQEEWFTLEEALAVVEPIMCGNAKEIFHID